MHPPSKDLPTQAQLVFPIIDVLREAGGRASEAHVVDAIATRLGLSDEVRQRTITTADGQSVNLVRRQIAYARLKGVKMGYIASAGRGQWCLPDEAAEALDKTRAGVIVTIHRGADGQAAAAQVQIAVGLPHLDTVHTLACADARDLSFIGDRSIQLAVSSIPYANLLRYDDAPGQLGAIDDFDAFVREIEAALAEIFRVLEPGGRACINVGDVLRSRKEHGRHHVLPLHADLLVAGRRVGFDTLTGIIWSKLGIPSRGQKARTTLMYTSMDKGRRRTDGTNPDTSQLQSDWFLGSMLAGVVASPRQCRYERIA